MTENVLFAFIGAIFGVALGMSIEKARKSLSDRIGQAKLDQDKIKALSNWFQENRLSQKMDDVKSIWHSERAFVNYFIAVPFSWRKRALNVKTHLIGGLRKQEAAFLDEIIESYSQAIGCATDSDSIRVNMLVWPFAELFEEITNLFKVSRLSHDPIARVIRIFRDSPGHHGIWALSRAMQEVQERGNRNIKVLDEIVRSQLFVESDLRIYKYCLTAGEFEERREFGQFLDNFDFLPSELFKFDGKDALKDSFKRGETLIAEITDKAPNESIAIREFKQFSLELMSQCADISSQWTAVSFFRIALQKINEPGQIGVLDEVASLILLEVSDSHWPVFPLTEIFEPVFCDLVSEQGLGRPGHRIIRSTSFTELLKDMLKRGLQGDTRCAQLGYGIATCAAERVEGGEIEGAEALGLLEQLTGGQGQTRNEFRDLLLSWFECRAMIYPRYVISQFNASPRYSLLARSRSEP